VLLWSYELCKLCSQSIGIQLGDISNMAIRGVAAAKPDLSTVSGRVTRNVDMFISLAG